MIEISALPETPRSQIAFEILPSLQDSLDHLIQAHRLHALAYQPFYDGRDGASSDADYYHHAEDFDDDDDNDDEYEEDDIDFIDYDKRP